MITGKIMKSLNQEILLEHWSPVFTTDDNSPSNKRFLIQLCNGCSINDSLIVNPTFFPKGVRPACLISCLKKDALKLLNTKRQDHMSTQVGISRFHYEQLTKFHYYRRLPPPDDDIIFDDAPSDVRIYEDQSANAKLIRSIVNSKIKQTELIRSSWNFNNRRIMTFYTDGSVQNINTPDIKCGCAWIETSNVSPIEYSTAIANQWISSFKTELIAVLLALLVSSPNSEVHIYTDSKSVIDKFKSLALNVSTFRYARDRLKDSHSSLWYSVFVVMETLNLKVIMHKVKAHNNNRFNDLTDKLAKASVHLQLPITFNCNQRFKIAPMHNGLEIESNLRRFVRDITQSIEFMKFVNQKRNIKYNKHRVDWISTTEIIKGDEISSITTFKESYYKSKRVKLFLEELPTMDFLKATKPHLYDESWCCPFCQGVETFSHVWTCGHHIQSINNIITSVKKCLFDSLVLVVENFNDSNSSYQQIITHGSWWTNAYDPFTITFVDLIKGVVPYELSYLINTITNNSKATLEILKSLYTRIYCLTQEIWRLRCKDIIKRELSCNITNRMKKQVSYGPHVYSRSDYIDVSTYQHIPNILTSADSLINKMVTYGCHFSNF
jgi:ribonuclease HI